MSLATSRGSFILFEGLDRCGKTTQCKLLADYFTHNLKMHNLHHMQFPDRTTDTGKQISAYLNNTLPLTDNAVHDLFAANRREKMEKMKKWLVRGENLVVDRYAFSGAAYTAAKGYDIEECMKADTGHLRPDVVYFIDVPVAVLQTRYGTEKYEKPEFQEKVLVQYNKLFDPAYWIRIDGTKSIEDVQYDIRVDVLSRLSSALPQPLHYIWPRAMNTILVNCTPHAVTVCGHTLPTLSSSSIRLDSALREYATVKFGLQFEPDKVSVAELRCTSPQEPWALKIPDDLHKYWDDEKTYTLIVSAMAAKFIVEKHLRKNVVAIDSSPAGAVRSADGQILGTTALEMY